jgi:predicted DNA-binding ribbon-helix-helix protein
VTAGGGITAPAAGFHGPVKRSITIAGHQTSISLEPVFWRALEAAATRLSLPLSALVAEIDAIRIVADDPPNMAILKRRLRISRNSIDSENDSQ